MGRHNCVEYLIKQLMFFACFFFFLIWALYTGNTSYPHLTGDEVSKKQQREEGLRAFLYKYGKDGVGKMG